MEKEIWKDIPNFEGFYQISNLGRVKSLDRTVRAKNGVRTVKERIMSLVSDKDGYKLVSLFKNNKGLTKKVHRLVATAFIPNPKNKPEVNHINGIKDDNRVENLEWSTKSENMKHSYKILGRKPQYLKGKSNPMYGRSGVLAPNHKNVSQFSLDGEFIRTFKTVREAGKAINAHPSSISKCANGYINQASGYKWRYE